MLGAVASGAYAALEDAMAAMSAARDTVEPEAGAIADYHARKHRVFQRMYEDQMAYRRIMAGAEDPPRAEGT